MDLEPNPKLFSDTKSLTKQLREDAQMINYNDGSWHRFDGGDCPVHPKSMVQTYFIRRGGEPETRPDNESTPALIQRWYNVIAFRVTEEYCEVTE